jgi:hypothetical protein
VHHVNSDVEDIGAAFLNGNDFVGQRFAFEPLALSDISVQRLLLALQLEADLLRESGCRRCVERMP